MNDAVTYQILLRLVELGYPMDEAIRISNRCVDSITDALMEQFYVELDFALDAIKEEEK